jgi:uncharacterized membrane protein
MTGEGLRDWVLVIVGNLFMAALALKAFKTWAADEWGQAIGLFLGAVVVGAAVWAPDQVKTVLTSVWGLFSNAAG